MSFDGQRRSVDDVANALRTKILTGEYGPEGRLIEEQIARELGVSRTPVRQALTIIEAEGLVEIFPNRGAIVASFSLDDVWHVCDLRVALEGLAARRAAENIDETELGELRRLATQMEHIDRELREAHAPSGRLVDEVRKEQVRCLVNLNQDFHHTIVAASRNSRLERLVRRTVQIPMVLKAFSWYRPEERAVTNHCHRKLIEVLASGDAQRAATVMAEHIYEARDVIVRALEEDKDAGMHLAALHGSPARSSGNDTSTTRSN